VTAPYAVLCGNCRDLAAVRRLMDGEKAQVVITSPPYAAQRDYDKSSGFEPIPAEKYVDWYKGVSDVLQDVLAPDGSYFLNIKEHAEDGQRHLYVKKLVIAHVESWGWRFVDEFCWRKTDNGVPGGWGNRFKNAFEPVFHFCRQRQIKFRPAAVGHLSQDCFDYSPGNPKSASGSGLLGCGRRGMATEANAKGAGMRKTRQSDAQGHFNGIARPSNVIEASTESNQGSHSAPFPVALPQFFIRAFSDPGDLVFDPFGGSGTTLMAAMRTGRRARCMEISPGYCDVVVRRMTENQTGVEARLAETGQSFEQVSVGRRLAAEAALRVQPGAGR
jgi:site-specific DNA-methyltransferase (adenine-specific)